METKILKKLAKLVRYYILTSTTKAGSGHPTSSLSAVELTVTLLFGGFFDKDRLIFSKGHASPLFYALYAAAGLISEEELMTLRRFGSPLEGHPSMEFPYTEVPTGSLGQGLSAGVGMALNNKYLDKVNYKTYVLLGDSEMAEGSVWEAIQIASFYKLDNLVGILDVNRLGQSRQTMLGYDVVTFQKRIASFGWETIVVKNGHNLNEIIRAYQKAAKLKGKPIMIIAKTVKGKGVSFLENKEGWHGKALSPEDLEKALLELGRVDKNLRGKISLPAKIQSSKYKVKSIKQTNYAKGEMIATRKAYGNALVRIFPRHPNMVVMDGETSNSTYSEIFAKAYPKNYFEMFIAEQNMVGAALGLSILGKIPFISTFAAFFTRAFDQARMAQYARANIKFCGSHAGVSIGEDGPSQMGLEDLAMFRTLAGSVVLYPSDAVSAEKLVEEAAKYYGLVYLRTTRKEAPVIYSAQENFPIGGCKIVKQSGKDAVTIVAAGVTLHEALEAYEILKKSNIFVRVIDLYSIKPLDLATLKKAAKETKFIITVEDHHPEGGLGEAVAAALTGVPVTSLAVRKIPTSGKPQELLDYEDISRDAIVRKVHESILR
ncbi:transketolase [Candidatus Daviesbacteria bacterium]|nr:transketolase [Candidatus Daviesbacteria bacterium]